MKNHDRYESLAGAIALGEATLEEREAFAAHAVECALCRQDLAEDAAGTSPLATVASARADETWRPSLDRAIVARLRERSAKHSRFTVSALGWGAALSIVVNVAFVTGLSGQVANALHPTTDAPPVANFGIRLPARTFAKVAGVAHPRGLALDIASRAFAPKRPATRSFAATLARAPAASAPAADAQPVDISDLLDASNARTNRNVAIEITLPVKDAHP